MDTFSPKSWATGNSTLKARQLNKIAFTNFNQLVTEELVAELNKRRVLRCKKNLSKTNPMPRKVSQVPSSVVSGKENQSAVKAEK